MTEETTRVLKELKKTSIVLRNKNTSICVREGEGLSTYMATERASMRSFASRSDCDPTLKNFTEQMLDNYVLHTEKSVNMFLKYIREIPDCNNIVNRSIDAVNDLVFLLHESQEETLSIKDSILSSVIDHERSLAELGSVRESLEGERFHHDQRKKDVEFLETVKSDLEASQIIDRKTIQEMKKREFDLENKVNELNEMIILHREVSMSKYDDNSSVSTERLKRKPMFVRDRSPLLSVDDTTNNVAQSPTCFAEIHLDQNLRDARDRGQLQRENAKLLEEVNKFKSIRKLASWRSFGATDSVCLCLMKWMNAKKENRVFVVGYFLFAHLFLVVVLCQAYRNFHYFNGSRCMST